MGLRQRVRRALKRTNTSALAAGVALAAGYVLTRALNLNLDLQDEPAPHPAAQKRGWPFWKAILFRVYEQINDDRVLALAAGVVFYALLALFPAITALVSSYALFANPGTIGDLLNSLAGFMPAGAFGIVRDQVVRIVGHTTGGLSAAFLLGLGLAVWSANAGMKAIIDALNIAYGVKEKRSFIALNAVSLAFTVGAIASMLLAFGAIVVLPVLLSYLPFDGTAVVLQWLRWPTLGVLLLLALAVLYRFGPDHVDARWHWITPGAILAAVAWLAGSALLSWYLANFADYDATYGSLGAAIGLMMWMWMSAIVVLTGAELNAELDAAAASADDLADKSGV
jgi:membrane protein